ncbi:NAD-dependent succinate-semialdehyde dehydrogenase [Chryseobacterium sp.]|uniref:NAD-dependent succinate-semialdehyde dehydrogenase n=1 Tax=Chryseobacterium sp. TaxID=1871047 RepID=UPI0025C0F5A1|nr:NAD-dependent succinate-semialdehyde dehydrogenase [Chryseobacterium sp.]
MEQKAVYKSLNPATGKIEKTFDEISKQDLDKALDKAVEAYKSWKKTSFAERAKVIKKAAELFRERKNELAKYAAIEMGKPLKEGIGEVMFSAHILDYYAENAEEFLKDSPIQSLSGKAFISYEPIGLLLSVQPWNFPYYQIIRTAAGNIMAGNTYMLKHASNVPQCALAVEQIFKDSGLPEGVYKNIFLSSKNIDTLVDDPRVKAATLTGSERAGSAFASAAAKNLKKTTLELGGSDPLIVLDDKNLDKIIKLIIMARFGNCGQICVSSKRIIVLKDFADQVLEGIKEGIKTIKVGDPLKEDTTMGPLSSEHAMEDVLKQIQTAVDHGAKLIAGGKRIGTVGAFMEPTILTDIDENNPIAKEEVFGPVLMLYVAQNEEEAIKLANNTDFGLGGTVFCSDEERAVKVAKQIETGSVAINRPFPLSMEIEIPFGGTKRSGYGRDHYLSGIREFLNEKTIKIEQL